MNIPQKTLGEMIIRLSSSMGEDSSSDPFFKEPSLLKTIPTFTTYDTQTVGKEAAHAQLERGFK